jgi:hypothetical protein
MARRNTSKGEFTLSLQAEQATRIKAAAQAKEGLR